jgi:hypothetical protein
MQSAYAVLCCHLWPRGSYHIFFTLSHEGHDVGKKFLNVKCVFWFSLERLSNIFLILSRMQEDTIINVHMYSCKVHVILVVF